jgi:hypothetical protein
MNARLEGESAVPIGHAAPLTFAINGRAVEESLLAQLYGLAFGNVENDYIRGRAAIGEQNKTVRPLGWLEANQQIAGGI